MYSVKSLYTEPYVYSGFRGPLVPVPTANESAQQMVNIDGTFAGVYRFKNPPVIGSQRPNYRDDDLVYTLDYDNNKKRQTLKRTNVKLKVVDNNDVIEFVQWLKNQKAETPQWLVEKLAFMNDSSSQMANNDSTYTAPVPVRGCPCALDKKQVKSPSLKYNNINRQLFAYRE
jgi:hypothetical protein